MKVLCIDNKNVSLSLTIGEWYKVISEDEHTYLIDNDHAYTKRIGDNVVSIANVAKSKFLSQEELRQLKLEKLGI
jgi:predicted Ser/Thr protein kinase